MCTLGAALARRLLELGWIKRLPSSRAICVVGEGEEKARFFGLKESLLALDGTS